MSVEVEKRFGLRDEEELARVEQQLLDRGAELTQTERLRDEYFDTPDLSLVRQDAWLRRRQGSWELKMPNANGLKAEMQCRVELSRPEQIWPAVGELGAATEQLACFACYDTERRTYLHRGEADERLTVVLDTALHEDTVFYRVGEVELMRSGGDDGQREAEQRVESYLEQMGLRTERVRSKMEEYLEQFELELYRCLYPQDLDTIVGDSNSILNFLASKTSADSNDKSE